MSVSQWNVPSKTSGAQKSAMLSREQLMYLFNQFSLAISTPEVKKRIADAVKDKQRWSSSKLGFEREDTKEFFNVMGNRRKIVRAVSCKLLFGGACFISVSHRQLLKQLEAVAVTTQIQEELLLKMGIDPQYGIACLGKVNTVYENDRELMLQFYDFVAKEELACDEAELGSAAFSEKIQYQQKLQEQQLKMLQQMRELSMEDQQSILQALHEQMERGQYEVSSAVMTDNQIQELMHRKRQSL